MSTLNVLMVSGDCAVFDPKSPVSKRVGLYSRHVKKLTLIVPTSTRISREEGVLHIFGAFHYFRPFRFWRIITVGGGLSRPDMLTAQDPFFLGLAAWLLSRHFRVPLELQVHTDVFSRGFVSHSFSNRIRALLALFLLKRADHVRTVSNRVAKSIHTRIQIPYDRISIVPVMTLSYEPVPDAVVGTLRGGMPRCARLVLMVARLAPEKNISLALRSLALSRSQGVDIGLVIVGGGPLRQKLESEVTLLGLKDLVFFAGQVSNPSPYYQCVDALLLTSQYEGYGLVLVEAAWAGLPIISTDVGIASELGAYIVDPTPESVSRALQLPLLPLPHTDTVPHWTEAEYVDRIVGAWHDLCRVAPLVTKDARAWMILKYVVSGVFASSLNLLLLYILTDFVGLWYVFSASFSYPAGYITSFFLQKFWTFRDGALQGVRRQFFIFITIGLINIALNAGLLYLIVESLHLHYLLGQIIAGFCIALWSFLAYKILFRPRV